MTGAVYAENLIEATIQLFRNEFGEFFIFQNDNAIPHPTQKIQNKLPVKISKELIEQQTHQT